MILIKYDSDLDLQIAACLDLLDVNDGESPLQHGHQYFATGSYRTSSNHIKMVFFPGAPQYILEIEP